MIFLPAATNSLILEPFMPAIKDLGKNPSQMIMSLACLQVLSATLFLKIPGFQYINSILFFVCGLAISYYILQIPVLNFKPRFTFVKGDVARLAFLLILLPVSYFLCRQIFDATPLQKENADMLPVMKVMGERFLDGNIQQVYDPIPEIWDGMQPIYLPAMWLPFTTSLLFHFDMRWITVCGTWLSVLIIIWPLKRIKTSGNIVCVVSLLVLLGWFHFEKTNNVLRLTEEGVVFFYYSLLTLALLLRNPWMTGLCIALCLLSRYALIGWIPFAIIFLVYKKEYRYLLKTATAFFVVALLLLLPFGMKPLLLHLQLPESYIYQSQKVWEQNPEFFYQSLGFAKFFGQQHIRSLHFILLAGTFIIPLLFFLFTRKKNISFHTGLLSCFQLSLSFFYSFLDVSYLYLYYTPVFVSLVIAVYLLASAGLRPKV